MLVKAVMNLQVTKNGGIPLVAKELLSSLEELLHVPT
jgi:hypothetical protein